MDKMDKMDKEYFASRQLCKPFATRLHLWGLATGIVIVGEFTIWGFALGEGYGSFLVSSVLVTIMYWILAQSLSELTAALPFSAGHAAFAESAFGPLIGSFNGYLYIISFSTFAALTCLTLGDYTAALTNTEDQHLQPLYWAVYFLIIYGLCHKSHILFNGLTTLCGISVLTIAIYIISTWAFLGKSDIETNYQANGAGGFFGTISMYGVAKVMPYGMWWYLGLEGLPVAAEQSIDHVNQAPVALKYSVMTLNLCAVFLIIFCPALPPGIIGLMKNDHPIVNSILTIAGLDEMQTASKFILYIVSLAPCLASFAGTFYCAYMFVYSRARGNYLPNKLSITNQHGTPTYAIIFTILLTYVICIAVYFNSESASADLLLRIVCFFSVLAYVCDLAVFIRLRFTMANFPRPYKSPTGITGALVATCIAMMIIIGGLVTDTMLHLTLWGISLCVVIVYVVYYKLVISKNVVFTPEKQFIKQQLAYMYGRSLSEGFRSSTVVPVGV